MLAAIEYQKAWRAKVEKYNETLPAWKRIFVPPWKHLSTWLNQQCWLDEHDEIPETEKPKPQKTMCPCRKEEGKYPVAGVLYCIKCYDRAAHPENYAPRLRVVK
jgi:hypothetical protein